MKKVKCFIAIAACALYLTACNGTKNSTGSGTTSPSTNMQNPGTTGTDSSGTMQQDSTHQR